MIKKIIRNETYFSSVIIYICLILIFVFVNTLLFTVSQKIIINLTLVLLVQFWVFYLFKLDFISCVTFLTAFLLWPSLLVYESKVSQQSIGLISMNIVPIYMYKDTFYILLFMILWSFIAFILQINIGEKHFKIKSLLNITFPTIIINNVIAILFSIVAFPTIPDFGSMISESRFDQGLLPGHAWNQLAIVALLFNLPYIRNHISVIITYLITISWFILHGERADISGLLLGIFILIMMSKDVNKVEKVVICFIGMFIVLFFIGLRSNDSIFTDINRITTFNTVSDVSYTFNAVINYILTFGYLHGKLFINMLQSAIPFNHGSNDIGFFVSKILPYPGGGSIVSTPLMDGGSCGIVYYIILYVGAIKFIVSHINKSYLCKYEILILTCSIPRISWYGVNYVFTSMIFFVPIIYFLDRYLSYGKI